MEARSVGSFYISALSPSSSFPPRSWLGSNLLRALPGGLNSGLSCLRKLWLPANMLSGTLPAEVCAITSLEWL